MTSQAQPNPVGRSKIPLPSLNLSSALALILPAMGISLFLFLLLWSAAAPRIDTSLGKRLS